MQRNGFSLVELSIVLVILGLLTGGILAGKSLIRASELRSVTVEQDRYRTAIRAFRDKYFALPGDMNNATSFWGTAASCPGDYTTPSTDSTTCNGDGSFTIVSGGGGPEGARFWQHLSNAGLIEGRYTGVTAAITSPSSSNFGAVGGVNLPLSRSGGEWFADTAGNVDYTSSRYFEGNYGNILMIGDMLTFATVNAFTKYFLPEEAWNIDTKLDDGAPGMGKVRTLEAEGATCNTVAASTAAPIATTATYKLTTTTKSCSLVFLEAF